MSKKPAIIVPEGCNKILLHACCAPCSSAIVEWLLAHNITPVIFYFNPNIYPLEEYEIRKSESKRHAESLGITWIDADYDHDAWLQAVCGLEHEPERGKRCEACFYHRLAATARKAQELAIPFFATTLASSRWKNLDQINAAGLRAAETVNRYPADSAVHEPVTFWAQPFGNCSLMGNTKISPSQMEELPLSSPGKEKPSSETPLIFFRSSSVTSTVWSP